MTATPSPKILLVGTGNMAREYAKVLKALKKSFLAVGRGRENALIFEKAIGIPALTGGLEKLIKENKIKIPPLAIIATNEEQLGPSARLLTKQGSRSILLEKPGGMNLIDLTQTEKMASKNNTAVFVAYNRRFYASTIKAREFIKKDGQVTSFNFDFTEQSHLVKNLNKSPEMKKEWLLMNSSHVLDLAFFLGGRPQKISPYKAGELTWHPNGSIYCGSGISDSKALFSYHANWESAGRWGVEVMTPKHKLIFRPLEKLHLQEIGQMEIKEVPLKNELDVKFKPGLYLQVKSFLGNKKDLLTISEQLKNLKHYNLIGGK